MQKLGQHFLKNKNVAAKIIDALALRAGDIVFEIGPGHGELTNELKMKSEKRHSYVVPAKAGIYALRNQKNEFRIIAIEKDENLCELLKKRFRDDKEIEIVCGDALMQLPLLVSKYENVGISKYKIVGNIPYYITGHLLRVISELHNKPERTIFMIQKEVAERIVAQPPKMNRLAASVQFWAEPKIIMAVPKNDFHPAPKVDSAVILLSRKDDSAPCNARGYYAAVRAIFSQPRKTILNNVLNGVNIKKSKKHKRAMIASALENIGISPECRPQNLSVENIKAVANVFFKGAV